MHIKLNRRVSWYRGQGPKANNNNTYKKTDAESFNKWNNWSY